MLIMVPVAIGLAAVVSYQNLIVPKKNAEQVEIRNAVAAANLRQYRNSIVSYLNSSPTPPAPTNGVINDTRLTSFFNMAGYVRNTTTWPWTNVMQAGKLYVYSTNTTCGVASCAGLMDYLYQSEGRAGNIGIAVTVGTNRRLNTSGFGLTQTVLPSAIPAGAAVFVGN